MRATPLLVDEEGGNLHPRGDWNGIGTVQLRQIAATLYTETI
jgi:hypothetical protein